MRLFDAHAHLCDAAFETDLGPVLERAGAAGVRGIVAVGETLEDARRNLELARLHPGVVYPAAGLFPTHLDPAHATSLEAWIREHRHDLVAIGEVGLDYWMVKDPPGREVQRTIFERFIALSLELDLPLNVHSRSTGRETIELLLARGARRVVLHAFDGKASSAGPAVEAGYFFSVPPSIVRSRQKRKLVAQLPLSSLLLETDSPVLGPVPGERNEPANLVISLQVVAETKSLPPQQVAEATEENARRLFAT
jgi:TatD DNase family protein